MHGSRPSQSAVRRRRRRPPPPVVAVCRPQPLPSAAAAVRSRRRPPSAARPPCGLHAASAGRHAWAWAAMHAPARLLPHRSCAAPSPLLLAEGVPVFDLYPALTSGVRRPPCSRHACAGAPSTQRSCAAPSPLKLAEGVPVLVLVVRSTAESRRVGGSDSGSRLHAALISPRPHNGGLAGQLNAGSARTHAARLIYMPLSRRERL